MLNQNLFVLQDFVGANERAWKEVAQERYMNI